ncbi:MAG TPA: hypothetical protein VFI42_06185 [Thermomicrobiaceae bacterium]|nr:hypothetical protein [Thermomicrobiaceae bacterium]
MSITPPRPPARDRYLGWVPVGLIGGELGGLALALTSTIWAWFNGLGFWYPLSLVGSLLLGESGVSHDAAAGADLLGVVILIVLSALFGLIFSYGVSHSSLGQGAIIALGIGWGLLLWAVGVAFIDARFIPAGLSDAPTSMMVVSFIAWGLLLGLVTAVSLARSPRLIRDRS